VFRLNIHSRLCVARLSHRHGRRRHHRTSRAFANIPCSGRANSLIAARKFPARSRQGIRLMPEHLSRVRQHPSRRPRAFTSTCARRVSFDVTSTFGHNGCMSRARASELVARCRRWGGARRRLVAVYRFLRGFGARRELCAKHSLAGAHSLLATRKFPARSGREFAVTGLVSPGETATTNPASARIFKNSLLNSLLSGNLLRRNGPTDGPARAAAAGLVVVFPAAARN
jgi:hypothetical protein